MHAMLEKQWKKRRGRQASIIKYKQFKAGRGSAR
jgi:hypothetical protein